MMNLFDRGLFRLLNFSKRRVLPEPIAGELHQLLYRRINPSSFLSLFSLFAAPLLNQAFCRLLWHSVYVFPIASRIEAHVSLKFPDPPFVCQPLR